jgi:hypothetical protein
MNTHSIFVKMIFDRWNALLKNADSIFDTVSDEQLQQELRPGKNRGIYLLGHLIAVHDDMLSILDLGAKEYPDLYTLFVSSPDNASSEMPSVGELRALWKKQLVTLTAKLERLTTDEWFEKHTLVSAEDFAKEPHRNKLNIILTRTTHLSYHVGQLTLLKQQ